MSEVDEYPKLIFGVPFDERTAWEVNQKGWFGLLTVELESGAIYEVFFYDPVRLSQDLKYDRVIAEPGMIVVPEITEATMREAINALYKKGWFDHLRPIEGSSQ